MVRRGGRHGCFLQLLGHRPRPATMPRTPRSTFDNAAILPILTILTADSGIKPRAKSSPACNSTCVEAQSSNGGRRCSVVMPERPATAPLLEDRRHQRNSFPGESLKPCGATSSGLPVVSSNADGPLRNQGTALVTAARFSNNALGEGRRREGLCGQLAPSSLFSSLLPLPLAPELTKPHTLKPEL